eukprot:249620_1
MATSTRKSSTKEGFLSSSTIQTAAVLTASICFVSLYILRQKHTKPQPRMVSIRHPLVTVVAASKYDGDEKPYTDLPGVTKDVSKHIDLWNGHFGYNMNILTDQEHPITKKKLDDFYIEVKQTLKARKHDSLICILTGHGSNESLITSDKERVHFKISQLRDWFSSNSFPTFSTKPKIFIVDVCRQQMEKKDAKLEKGWENIGDKHTSHPDSNMCFIYSSTKHYQVPDLNDGSPMIQCLVDVMSNIDLETNDLNRISVMIGDEVAKETGNSLCVEVVSTNKYLVYFQCNDGNSKVIMNGKEYTRDVKSWYYRYAPTSSTILIPGVLLAGYLIYCGRLTYLNRNRRDEEKYGIPSILDVLKIV